MSLSRRTFLISTGAAFGATTSAAALAFGDTFYPSRPVRIVAPVSPGGVVDLAARLVAPKLSQQMGQQFYVENIPGGASNVGTQRVARANPDGHTLLCTAPIFVINAALNETLPYAPKQDFNPITLLCTTPVALTANPKLPVQSLDELTALIKKNPGSFSYASPGVGTPPHLVGEMFRTSLGLDIAHTPYKSGGEALAATMAGHTPLCFGALGVAIPQIKAGTARPIAIASSQRSPLLPTIPTMQEAGHPDILGAVWVGLLTPSQTPSEVITALYQNVELALSGPDVIKRLNSLGFDVVGSRPSDFGAQIIAELVRYKKVVQATGIKPT